MRHHSLTAALDRIDSGPAGPKVGAFFEVDGTILSGSTVGVSNLAKTAAAAVGSKLGGDTAGIGDLGVTALRGQTEEDVVEFGERLFAQKIGQMIRPQAREVVRAHKRKGHTVVIASSATRFQVEPVARNLGIERVVCTEVEVDDGILTGQFTGGGMLWGDAKSKGVRAFARRAKLSRPLSYAYGNIGQDAALLASVGHPVAVNPRPELLRVAELEGWPVLTLEDPGRRGLKEAVSTLAALGGLNVGLAVGVGIGALRRDSRTGADLGVSLGVQSFLALAGVTLDVVGRQNMFVQRPCVFVVNHQSALDALIVMALAQGGLSGMGKKEARFLPPTYLLSRAMNTVWVDRTDPAAARVSQQQLVQRLKDGLSVMVAPEGTRQPTPVLGPFKTGAFHVALDAGVPVVPVIVRNAYDLQPGSAMTTRSGVVMVAVLEPIPTDTWTKATIRDHVAEVRQKFVETMDNWPGEER